MVNELYDLLKQDAASDKDIEEFVTKRLLKGFPIKFNVTESGMAYRHKNSIIDFEI